MSRMRLHYRLRKTRRTNWSDSFFTVFEFARMNDSQSHPSSKGTDRYRASADVRWKGERGERQLSESERERERSRCIDRRHKIHFMTWTLSSDWCISRRIASQIKRSSTLEPPLTTSPGPRRRRTMPSTLVCISHPAFSLFTYMSPILSRYTSAGL